MVMLKQMRNHCNEKHNSCLQINKTETKLACDSTEIKKIDEKKHLNEVAKWAESMESDCFHWFDSMTCFHDMKRYMVNTLF